MTIDPHDLLAIRDLDEVVRYHDGTTSGSAAVLEDLWFSQDLTCGDDERHVGRYLVEITGDADYEETGLYCRRKYGQIVLRDTPHLCDLEGLGVIAWIASEEEIGKLLFALLFVDKVDPDFIAIYDADEDSADDLEQSLTHARALYG